MGVYQYASTRVTLLLWTLTWVFIDTWSQLASSRYVPNNNAMHTFKLKLPLGSWVSPIAGLGYGMEWWNGKGMEQWMYIAAANSCNWRCCSRLCWLLCLYGSYLTTEAVWASPVLPALFLVWYYDVMVKTPGRRKLATVPCMGGYSYYC